MPATLLWRQARSRKFLQCPQLLAALLRDIGKAGLYRFIVK